MWDVGDEVFCAKQETIFWVKQSRRWKIRKQEVGDRPKKQEVGDEGSGAAGPTFKQEKLAMC